VTQSPPPVQTALVQQQLADARLGAKKLRWARGVAQADAWMIAIFAACSFICGLFGDVSGVLIGLAMGVIAYIEFDGAGRIRRLDSSALRRLGYNQLAFATAIIVYALWSLHSSTIMTELKSQLPPDYEELAQLAINILYTTLIAVAIFAQGGTALYYFSRQKYMEKYVKETPGWILEMQRSGGPL
jgi:hypothetical protein